jgi:hypothetical protein
MAFSKADGTPRRAAPVTSLYGGGVIWKAWELGLFEGEEWRDELRAIAKGQCKPYLESLCQHDLAIKKCFGCYMALDTTGVLLYNTEEEKSLFVEAADWSLFEADLAQDPKGYEILAIREPFSPPSYG